MNNLPPTGEVPKQKRPVAGQIVQVAATVVGLGIGWYCGIYLLIPLMLAFGTLWLLAKIPSAPTASFRIAWAVQFAQLLWLGFGVIYTSAWSQGGLDLVILIVGLIWLWLRPNLGPVILLGIYQLGAAMINFVSLLNAEVGSFQNKALVAHLCLRVAAIAFLVIGCVKTRSPGV